MVRLILMSWQIIMEDLVRVDLQSGRWLSVERNVPPVGISKHLGREDGATVVSRAFVRVLRFHCKRQLCKILLLW